jgi:glycosyltransferase involved in cell wall biosynthesis
MSPFVAVIIPTYNRAHLLERAVQSVLNQTFREFELVVVDDGSTDDTAHLLLIRNPDPRLRYIRLPANRGVSRARNTGVTMTTAPWLAFLDSDDEWLPRKLEKQVRWIHKHPYMQIVQTREIWMRRGRRVNPPLTHEKSGGDLFFASLERCMVTPSSVMLRRPLLDEAGGFDESLPACEDYDLWLKITCRFPVGLVDEYLLTRYGGHSDQLSAAVPLLDRFRIRSIRNLLAAGCLTADQQERARKILLKKAKILAHGYEKHGNRAEHERYEKIIAQYS